VNPFQESLWRVESVAGGSASELQAKFPGIVVATGENGALRLVGTATQVDVALQSLQHE
jgi:hypothetical protein